MTDHKDPAALARRFVDLWQDQLSAVARDPELADAAARWWRFWVSSGHGTPATPDGAGNSRPSGDDRSSGEAQAGELSEPRPARPQAAGAASRDRDADMDELARRVRELEARLAALEPGDPPGRKTPARRPRRVSTRRRPD